MRFSVEEAEKKFGELIDLAQRGEEVIIEQGDRPVAEIIPIPIKKGKFKHGLLKDVLKGPVPDFLEPMSEEELLDWEGRD
jgi:antitoxin (DNA-binding transcriptional repressor) of toxin-antitoxin stability system